MQQAPNNELYDFPTERGRGIIGTLIFHVALLALLVVTGFHTPTPLPEEEGILVNFGYDETGLGEMEPAVSSSSADSYIPPESNEVTTDEAVEQIIEDITSEQTTLTQDFEEAVEVVKQVEQPDPEAERRRLKAIEDERIRKQQIEADRIKREQEEAERKRLQEEQDRIAREAAEQEARRTDIFNRTRNALNNAAGTGTNANPNQGIAGGTGNQGVETGSVDEMNYGDGSGTGTRGISFDLAGRTPTKLPQPTYDIQEEGIVVVEVTVDRNGNVTQATAGVKGSTTLDEYFLRVAKEAAIATKFNTKTDAPVFQKGTITYHFILK